jgi:hypothetical protein
MEYSNGMKSLFDDERRGNMRGMREEDGRKNNGGNEKEERGRGRTPSLTQK